MFIYIEFDLNIMSISTSKIKKKWDQHPSYARTRGDPHPPRPQLPPQPSNNKVQPRSPFIEGITRMDELL